VRGAAREHGTASRTGPDALRTPSQVVMCPYPNPNPHGTPPRRGRAEELGDILLAAYNTSSGLPAQAINLRDRSHGPFQRLVLSELGTQQARVARAFA